MVHKLTTFQNEITIGRHDAVAFQCMLENPEELALTKRDEFISDVSIDVQLNGEITINCDYDFNGISSRY